ncbi:hypothetical protein Q428_13755 [Fervidicella metallireducens AeB]|uniref:Prolow-density lipoprotein receptor-related protein 1-like beta-propeller domain-containing protein n=1 Tax=Fervidicella metallireducens AeB TaxID=1403537 RepID=A0A017RTX3_9CLOT|nr:hypothetical protein Q428_13755 [Fervidicella metallireducens AeB]
MIKKIDIGKLKNRIKNIPALKIKVICTILLISIIAISSVAITKAQITFGSSANILNKMKIELKDNLVYPSFYNFYDDKIYYVSLYDRHIYKINNDGSKREKLTDDRVDDNGIIVNGQWIYYVNSADDFRFYRVKIDGTSRERLSSDSMVKLYESFVKYMGYVYYTDSNGTLHKYDSDGKEIADICENEQNIVWKFTLYSKVYGDYLYSWDYDGIKRTNLLTGNTEEITKDSIYPMVEFKDGWIYYINNLDYKLYKIKTDGKDRIKLTDEELIISGPDYDMGRFTVIEDSIYYLYNNMIYKIKTDGTNKNLIVDGAKDFTTNNKYIYYIDEFDNGSLYRVNLEGRERNKLINGSFGYLLEIKDNKLIFVAKSETVTQPSLGRLFILDLKNNKDFELK